MLPEHFGVTADLGHMQVDTRLAVTTAIVLGGLLLRWGVVRLIRNSAAMANERRRWWIVTLRNSLNIVTVLALIVLWAPELEEFALSITAFVVALVIATKELILCVSGATWARTTSAFGMGDWVEIGGHSGEVIDESLFVTQLQEIEKREFRYTGRTIAVPNSVLLTQPVINHNFRKRFLEHEFVLHVPAGAHAPLIADAIRQALEEESGAFSEVARRYAAVIEKRAGLRLPGIDPVVRIQTNPYGNIEFRCALFCPRDRTATIEDAAARAMFSALAGEATAAREAAQ